MRIFGAILCVILFYVSANASAVVTLSQNKAKQGSFFTVTIKNTGPVLYRIGFLDKKYSSLPIFGYKKTQYAIIPVPVDAPLGVVSVSIESDLEFILPKEIEIEKTEFPVSDSVITNLPLKFFEQKRYDKERKILDDIYLLNTKYPFFDERYFIFYFPLEGNLIVSSEFGTVRKIKTDSNGSVENKPHFGIDYVVLSGTRVYAAETGIVRFSGDLLLSGKTIILDHGFGLFSVYFHLSRIDAKEGDVVLRSEAIGRSGATGRTRGAHLHFGVRVHDIWVDPTYFLKNSGGEK